jgi:hypothetical protein
MVWRPASCIFYFLFEPCFHIITSFYLKNNTSCKQTYFHQNKKEMH